MFCACRAFHPSGSFDRARLMFLSLFVRLVESAQTFFVEDFLIEVDGIRA
jgi:hypothetical protein